jgi:hypothetical protein
VFYQTTLLKSRPKNSPVETAPPVILRVTAAASAEAPKVTRVAEAAIDGLIARQNEAQPPAGRDKCAAFIPPFFQSIDRVRAALDVVVSEDHDRDVNAIERVSDNPDFCPSTGAMLGE